VCCIELLHPRRRNGGGGSNGGCLIVFSMLGCLLACLLLSLEKIAFQASSDCNDD
jgi:hypothetical protein